MSSLCSRVASEVLCCSAEECALEFRLASCGQDSRLKIWIVAQDERDGRSPHLSSFIESGRLVD